jgi:hypothetical protein
MVTGLTPGAPYTGGVAANGGTTTVTVTAGGGVNADVGGVIGIASRHLQTRRSAASSPATP